ncbi:kynureninase [Pseudoalteromonas sp. MBR-15]|jgi:selenocysteine lyase/cysteine desulfurase|uniref:aminotransferase class V-fold PLP-dependent enzyme n=1 Tax=Pseudoalteromonas lipolytica TaxID=570156 RepID=UPI003BA2085C
MRKHDFILAPGSYLLNHSVGRALKSAEPYFHEHFFAAWQNENKEPWQQWLHGVEAFTSSLARLFNSDAELFCPQVNLSSGLTKLVMSHPRLQQTNCTVLMAESDFPSMGFAMQKALPACAEIVFIGADEDLTDAQVWQSYLAKHAFDLVFVSHVYSNTGQQAPIAEIIQIAKQSNTLSLIDIAQSAGILEVDLTALDPDFMLGSSVKWLCGGPGAAYLWVNRHQLALCQPKDVGWFSHQNPFEFDIKHFTYHHTALRFWGGTPSVAPCILAAHSIRYFADLGIDKVRAHNLAMLATLHAELSEYMRSPSAADKCSGTAIMHFGRQQQAVKAALHEANIAVDERHLGLRVSAHVYNDDNDINDFIKTVKSVLD